MVVPGFFICQHLPMENPSTNCCGFQYFYSQKNMNNEHLWNSVYGILGGIIISVVTGFFWRRRDRLRLVYTKTVSDLFPTGNGDGKYYAIKVWNNGKKEVRRIKASIILTDVEINQVTTHSLMENFTRQGNEISFQVDCLNKGEDISFVITTNKDKHGTTPKIVVRGEGVTASEKQDSSKKSDYIGITVLFFLIGFLGGLVYAILEDGSPGDTNTGPQKVQTVFTILNKAGLSQAFPRVIDKAEESYVATGYAIAYIYLEDTVNRVKYVNALKELSALPDIAENSKGTIYYLIYKIDMHGRNPIEATEYLTKCKIEAPKIYEYLYAQDRYFSLEQVIREIR